MVTKDKSRLEVNCELVEQLNIYERKGDLFVDVYVKPDASKNGIVGIYNGSLKLSIRAPARKGEANDALIEFFSELFSIPKKDIEIILGTKSRYKIVKLRNLELKRFIDIVKSYL